MLIRRSALRLMATGSAALSMSAYRTAQTRTEILVRGGRIANADGVIRADVRIVGEVISEIGIELRPGTDALVIEAEDHLVVPGGIDPHTHLHPAAEALSPPAFADDLITGSQAALAGGITTVGSFVYPRSSEPMLDAMDRVSEQVRTDAICDAFLHAGRLAAAQ